MSAKKAKRIKEKNATGAEVFGRALDLPPGILTGGVHISLLGNKEVTVEGCRGVLEYDDALIKLNIGSGTVTFCGQRLRIVNLDRDHTRISGKIETVTYDM